ncbi:MAG TPA: hypothetical protein VGM88_34905 [Kofleriaceae bacterium]|jgi:hypothetical protein
MRTAALLVVCAACGRFGFQDSPQDGAVATEAGVDAAPDAPTTQLTCGTPAGFDVGANQWQTLRATGTDSGYVVVGETTGTLGGWSFGFDGTGSSALQQQVGGAVLVENATDNANMGLAARGDSLVLAAMIGRPDATGAQRGQFGAGLTGPSQVIVGEIPAPVALARGPGDAVAYLTANADSELDMQLLDDTGQITGEKVFVADAAEHTGDAAIAAASGGYIAAWTENSASPNPVRVELLDGSQATPITAGSTLNQQHDESHPRVAWNAPAQRYIVTWTQKTATEGDEIWFDIRDASLTEVVVPTRAVDNGYGSKVIADASGFLLAWGNGSSATHLGAARISPAGAITQLTVNGSGGTAIDYDVVAHDGQSAIVWAETGGSGPTLWIDALCSD